MESKKNRAGTLGCWWYSMKLALWFCLGILNIPYSLRIIGTSYGGFWNVLNLYSRGVLVLRHSHFSGARILRALRHSTKPPSYIRKWRISTTLVSKRCQKNMGIWLDWPPLIGGKHQVEPKPWGLAFFDSPQTWALGTGISYPIGSMGGFTVYLPTWMVDVHGKLGKYTYREPSHGSLRGISYIYIYVRGTSLYYVTALQFSLFSLFSLFTFGDFQLIKKMKKIKTLFSLFSLFTFGDFQLIKKMKKIKSLFSLFSLFTFGDFQLIKKMKKIKTLFSLFSLFTFGDF